MRIGYDAKRAFTNFTGLGNYSRDTIRIISSFFNKNDYVLYTPKTNLMLVSNHHINYWTKSLALIGEQKIF